MSGFGYNVLGFGANASSAAGGASDDEFNRVSFLSHFDGANNGVNNSFDDGSASNHTITANGNVTQGSFNPYGTNWAVDFSKDTNPRLSCSSSADFTFGTGDFTVEFFVFFYSLTSYQTPMSAGYNNSGGMFIQTGNGDGKFQFRSGSSALVSETTSDAEANKWYHIAFSRQSGTLRVYRNGVQTGTASNSTNLNRVGNILIGSDQDFNIDGLLSNFRLVKGTSLYNSNFTPPASALTAVTNTTLLTLQSNRFVDNSASGHTVTPNTGKETVTAFGPFLTSAVYDPAVNGASAYFDGTGDYLDADDGVTFGTGAFTIEFFVYLNRSNADQKLFDARPDGVNTVYPVIYILSNNTIVYYANSGVKITSSETLSENAWYHVAVCRSGTSTKMFLDGTQVGSTYSDSTNYADSGRMRIGASKNATNTVEGYMSNVRVVHSALYTSNFTPPTAPLTAITNTKLLLNMADGQAIDSTAQNNLTLYGTAKTSTAQKLFGDASLLLDGNSDLVTFPTEAGNFGTGNFTIEFSFRLAADVGSTPNSCVAKWETSGSQRSWMIRIDNVSSANKMKFFDSADGSASTGVTFSTPPSSETWYKISLVNVSGTVSLYVNGTADSTTHSLATGAPYASTGLVSIGANVPSNPDNFFNGNIDEVRLSKFARYTADFTAPTAAFPDKGQ